MILTGRKRSTSRRQHGSQLEHVASLLSVKAHVPGLQDSHTASPDNDIGDGRKRQSNRYKRQAKKRKFQADMEQLENFRTGGGKSFQAASRGKDYEIPLATAAIPKIAGKCIFKFLKCIFKNAYCWVTSQWNAYHDAYRGCACALNIQRT